MVHSYQVGTKEEENIFRLDFYLSHFIGGINMKINWKILQDISKLYVEYRKDKCLLALLCKKYVKVHHK